MCLCKCSLTENVVYAVSQYPNAKPFPGFLRTSLFLALFSVQASCLLPRFAVLQMETYFRDALSKVCHLTCLLYLTVVHFLCTDSSHFGVLEFGVF